MPSNILDGRPRTVCGINWTPAEAERLEQSRQVEEERLRRVRLWALAYRLGAAELDWELPLIVQGNILPECDTCGRLIDLAAIPLTEPRITPNSFTCEACVRGDRGASTVPVRENMPWTPDEIVLVLRLDPWEAARQLGRSLSAVRSKRQALRPPPGVRYHKKARGMDRKPWTATEDAVLREVPGAEAARRLGRSIHAIYRRRRALGLHGD